ncbi:MAG: alpha/beta hydrolase [Oscillospiraceae bacterium]|nr:alpha/beta hydrolase [Oscillospiraceae bacterium]
MAVQTIQSDGMTMQYFCFGNPQGQPFVILPGVSLRSVMLSETEIQSYYQAFSAQFHVFVMERRSDLPERYSAAEMADDTIRAFDALGLRDIALYGVSQGGMTAQEIVLKRPGLVRKLVLSSTACHVTAQASVIIAEWRRLAAAHDVPALVQTFVNNVYTPGYCEKYRDAFAAYANAVTEEDLRRFLIMISDFDAFDVRARLHTVQCPVLVIAGGQDKLFGTAPSEQIAAQTGGELCIYPGSAHSVYDEEADVLNRILKFLS